MWKNPVRCLCVENFKWTCWKMTEFWCFEGGKRPFSALFPAISVFSRFSKFVRFGLFKKWFYGHVPRSWRKTDLETLSRRPNLKFSIIIKNYWDFWAGRLLGQFSPISSVYSGTGIYTIFRPCSKHSHRSHGGGEGRMIGRFDTSSIFHLTLPRPRDLELEYAHRKLRMILRSVTDRIHVVVLTYFHFIRL